MDYDSIQAAIKAGQDLTSLHEVNGFRPALVIPSGQKVDLTPEKLEAPRFLSAAPYFHDAEAFIAYVNEFKDSGTRLFYAMEGVFVAVLDYHQFATPRARHADHVAKLVLKRSPEWLVWEGQSEEQMGQQEFAEFLEDNARDILEPGAEVMLEIATGLHATIGATFRQAVNQANGTVNMQWDEQVDGTVRGSNKAIPTTFKIALRPFMGTERYPVDCRLRYRINSGRLAFHFKALHLDPITEAAVEEVVIAIANQTGITPALGAHDADAVRRGV